MAADAEGGLVGWYEDRIGEPETRDEAVGYWVFAVGLVAGAVGILLAVSAGPASTLRELAVVFGAAGIVLLVAGPIVRLPLQRRATLLTYLGVALAAVAILWFIVAFPDNWSVDTGNPSIIGLYGLGIALIAIAGVFIPLLTGGTTSKEATAAAKAETAEASRALVEARAALADATADEADLAAELRSLHDSQAQFETYQDAADEWRWRLHHRNGNVIADGGEGYTQLHNAQKGLQSVRRNALGATVVQTEREADLPDEGESFDTLPEEPSQATFEVFEDDAGEYRWRLVHDNGNVLADSGEGYVTKHNAERALEGVTATVSPADYLWFDPAGFETYRDTGGQWRWRLVHRNGNILADGGEGYASHGNARRAVQNLQDRVDELEFDIYEDSAGNHRWRLVAENDEIVADSGEGYSSRDAVEDAVDRVERLVPEADTLEVGMAAFEIYEDESETYRWRLRHRNGNVLADSGEGYADRSNVRDAIESVKRNAPGADVEG
ncbi:DUF1508 domain-containing protein [Haloparvum sp. AD34]